MKISKDKYIHISPEWAIQGDEICVTLFKKRLVKKTGQVQYDPYAYFPSLDKCLKRCIDMDLGPINNLKALHNRIDELKKYISDFILDRLLDDQEVKHIQLYTLQMKCLECLKIRK